MVELLKYPTEDDLLWLKRCTLNTVGKDTAKAPNDEWVARLVDAEHSPIRELIFGIKMEVPYFVSVHFVRHHVGVTHYVQTQRTDRTGVDRNKLPQDAMVTHIMSINAQALIHMAHKRLCRQASLETQEVMKEIVRVVTSKCPYMKNALVPLCVYRGGCCTEMFPCK